MKDIRVGIIGTGQFARHHVDVWKSINNVKIIGAYGTDKKRVKRFSSACNCNAFYEFDKLAQNCDVVDIVSTNNTHADYALMSINVNCHTIIEKPIDINIAKAQKVLDATKEYKKIVTTISNYRYSTNFIKMKNALDLGVLGDIVGGRVSVVWPRLESYYKNNGGWRGDSTKVGGGVLMHQCFHHIDLLHWMFGPVSEVSGYKTDLISISFNDSIERTFSGLLKFKSGVVIELFFTTMGDGYSTEKVEIFGSLAKAVASSNSFMILDSIKYNSIKVISSQILDIASRLLKFKKTEGPNAFLRRQFQEVINNVSLGENSLSVSAIDGVRTLKTIQALYKSDKEKCIVFL
jgi:predicted dehydrogenase